MKLYFDDPTFDGQLQRSVGKVDAGTANVGECLAIAEQIVPGDRDSWYRAWFAFADRLADQGETAIRAGHPVSGRRSLLRASEYFRQAFFFHRDNLNGEELRSAYPAGVRAFRAALPHLGHPARAFGGDEVSGYLFAPDSADGPLPTILHLGGYDGTAEELYTSVPPALERGYVFVGVDGPGQGAALYDSGVPMRPDWEHVLPRIVDAVVEHPEVDARNIVLVGRSFGGWIAPRAASGDARVAALVVDPGQLDLGSAALARLGVLADHVHDPAWDVQFEALLEIPALQALLAPRMVTHGVTSVRRYFVEMLRYTTADVVDRITCPTFVTDNESDQISTGQGKILFDQLTCPKEFRLFTRSEGAEGHCEGLAPGLFWDTAFDWLDKTVRS